MKTKSLIEVDKNVRKELGIIDIAELKEGKNESGTERQRKTFIGLTKE